MYEVFDHTADLGLRISGASQEELLAEAGRGLCSVLVEDLSAVQATSERALKVSGTEPDLLLFDWLTELLYLYETEQFLPAQFAIEVTSAGLRATIRGESADPARHQLTHEVKAVTYHLLEVRQSPAGWDATVILDI